MTISRRDTLRLAAAVTATRGIAPFAVSPQDAAAMLAEPAAFNEVTVETMPYQMDHMDPVTFADHLESNDTSAGNGFVKWAAEELAEYKRALERVIDLDPALLALHIGHPLNDLDEAVVAMGNSMWRAGVLAGAAYEHLRLALTATTQLCFTCQGHGRVWPGGRTGGEFEARRVGNRGEDCPECGGRGFVPTPPLESFFATN